MIMPHLYFIMYINFILFNNTNLLFVNLYDHTPPIFCHNVLFSLCSTMLLIIFVNLYDHVPSSITCINFILLNLSYLHIYMIMHPMYYFCFV